VTPLTATTDFYFADSFYTAVVSGVSFSAQNEFVWPDGVNVATTDITYIYLTFPQLTVTSLHPGEAITMVLSGPVNNSFADKKEWTQIGGASGQYEYLPSITRSH